MRMPQHDVRNEGYGPYVMFYCEKCQREYHSTAKVVNTVAQDTAKSMFGGLLRNIPVVGMPSRTRWTTTPTATAPR
jgi:hypothetical protein